jgi:hypothetical protein
MFQSKKLANLIELSSSVQVYVPSTCNVDQKIDNSEKVNSVLSELSSLFGGSTSFEAIGCWKSSSLGLVKEHITICKSYCTESQLQQNIEKVISICEELKVSMSQEAISLEVNNKLYFI